MVDEAMEQALATMPKCELHLHIEGTLEPDLAFAFAKRNSVALPWASIDELRAQYEFEDLQSFLDLYYALMRTLKTKDDFKDLMVAYLTRANADGSSTRRSSSIRRCMCARMVWISTRCSTVCLRE